MALSVVPGNLLVDAGQHFRKREPDICKLCELPLSVVEEEAVSISDLGDRNRQLREIAQHQAVVPPTDQRWSMALSEFGGSAQNYCKRRTAKESNCQDYF